MEELKVGDILEKAEKGGWKLKPALQYVGARYPIDKDIVTVDCVFTDPLFWQALGKACGWGQEIDKSETGEEWGNRICLHCGVNTQYQPPKESGCNHVHYPEACPICSQKRIIWTEHALHFHEINLTEGFEKAVEYLKNLIS